MRRWIDLENLKEKTFKTYEDTNYKVGGFVLSADEKGYYQEDSEFHNLIIGSTGSKKSRLVAMPLVVNSILSQNNAIVLDIKGEIYDYTSKLAEENGYEIIRIDFRNPKLSSKWNPLLYIYELYEEKRYSEMQTEISSFSDILFPLPKNDRDHYWVTTGSSFFRGVLALYLGVEEKENISIKNFLNFFNVFIVKPGDIMEEFYKKNNILHRSYSSKSKLFGLNLDDLKFSDLDIKYKDYIYSLLITVTENADMTGKSIISVAKDGINRLNPSDEIVENLSGTIDLYEKIYNNKIIIYLVTPEDGGEGDTLVNLFVEQSYKSLSKKMTLDGGIPLSRTLHYILDEFANITSFKYFDRYVSVGRSKNIKFTIVLQDLEQLEKSYPETSSTILSNINNIAFLYSHSKKTIDYLLNRIGNTIDKDVFRSLDKENNEILFVLGRNPIMLTNMMDISDFVEKVRGEQNVRLF